MTSTLRRNRRTTARVRTRAIIRMAISLFGLAALAGTAAAQSDPRPTYTTPVYNARISPWPSAAPPAAPAVQTTPAQGPWGSPPAVPLTYYYKKEPGTGVVPAANVYLPSAQDPPKAAPKSDPPDAAKSAKVKDILEMPPPEKLFRLESEAKLQERITSERKLTFPTQSKLSAGDYTKRSFAQMAIQVEPHYVCYGRLFFEEKNTERYGWDLGPITPLLLAAQFGSDVSSLPYKICSFPRLRYDCSAGLCLPGDPVPLLSYPMGFSGSGALGQAAVTVAMYAIFP